MILSLFYCCVAVRRLKERTIVGDAGDVGGVGSVGDVKLVKVKFRGLPRCRVVVASGLPRAFP